MNTWANIYHVLIQAQNFTSRNFVDSNVSNLLCIKVPMKSLKCLVFFIKVNALQVSKLEVYGKVFIKCF